MLDLRHQRWLPGAYIEAEFMKGLPMQVAEIMNEREERRQAGRRKQFSQSQWHTKNTTHKSRALIAGIL